MDGPRARTLLPTRICFAAKSCPGIHRVQGFQGAQLLRRDGEKEVEFVTITLFESMRAVKEFAGEDYEVAVVPPDARKLLSRFDERSAHYETVFRTD